MTVALSSPFFAVNRGLDHDCRLVNMLYQCLLSKEESGRPIASNQEKAETETNEICDRVLY